MFNGYDDDKPRSKQTADPTGDKTIGMVHCAQNLDQLNKSVTTTRKYSNIDLLGYLWTPYNFKYCYLQLQQIFEFFWKCKTKIIRKFIPCSSGSCKQS